MLKSERLLQNIQASLSVVSLLVFYTTSNLNELCIVAPHLPQETKL